MVRWLAYAFILLLVLPVLAVAEATVTIEVTDGEIQGTEEALFTVTVSNLGDATKTYTLYGLDVAWSVDPDPRRFTLGPGQSKVSLVRVRPLGPFQPSAYSIKLHVDENEPERDMPATRYTRDLPVVLFPLGPVDYLPSISVTVDLDEKINPRETVPLKLFLKNKNPLDLKGLVLRIQSDIPEFSQEVTLDLPPLQDKTVEFTIVPNPYQQPKEYALFFVFEHYGEAVKVVEEKIEVVALTPPFTVDTGEELIFLKRWVSVRVHNSGNVRNTQEVGVPVSGWNSLFTSGGDVRSREGQRQVVWEISLGPNEEVVQRYVINNRIPLYLVLFMILFGLFYLAVRSSVRLHKTATTVKAEEGTLSEVKVTLEIENKSSKQLKDITVTDLVPGIANVEKGLDLGTLKPHEIKHTKKGTKVLWTLAELEPKEHRLITYKIRTKLHILGSFSLPRATVEYGRRRGKHRKAYSNLFSVGG